MRIDKRIVLIILFILISLLCPIATSPTTEGYRVIGYAFISLLYMCVFGSITDWGIVIVTGPEYWLTSTLIMIPLTLVFSVEVINCMNGKTSKNRVYHVGLLSFAFPGLFLTWMYLPCFFLGIIGYAGPIPIQFIFGMGIVSKYGSYIEELHWPDEE